MPHELEIREDGEAAMVSVREVPWHGLGMIVPEVLTAKEAMVAAGLDWEVELYPLFAKATKVQQLSTDDSGEVTKTVVDTDQEVAVPGQFAVVRDSDLGVLGVVGSQYRPIQNYKSFELFDGLVGSGEAKYETAGSLRDGRQIFMTAKIPREILIGGVDAHDLYLALVTSHDGSRAFTCAVTGIRIVCMNTANWALERAQQSWTIKHTESADGRIAEAREALNLTFAYADEFEKLGDELINTPFSKAEFEKLVADLVPVKDKDDAGRQIRMAMIGTLESSQTIDDSFRYTKWGALNAVSEYTDWVRPIKASKTKSLAEQRTEATWFGPSKKLKEAAVALLTAN